MTPPRRPRPRHHGAVRLYVVRGPAPDGRWYWRAEVRRAGTYAPIWCGWATVKEADQAVVALVARGGLDTTPSTRGPATVERLLRVWTAHMDGRPDLAPATRENATRIARRLKADLGPVLLDRLDAGTLEDYRDRRLRSGAATGTVALDLATLGAAWRWGRRLGLVVGDPPTVRVRVERRDNVTPTAGQVAAVVGRLHGWHRAAVLLLFATGARVGEALALTWDQVDLDDCTVTLDGKTGRRVIPVHPRAVAELADLPREGDLVLGEVRTRAALRLAIARACRETETPTFSPHGIRRLACDVLYRSGADVGTAAALLGHSPQVALAYYRRASAEDMRRAVTRSRLGVLPAGDVINIERRK